MPAVRRSTDAPGEDHFRSHEREEIDWRKSTPRSHFIVVIYILLGALSFLGSFSYWAITDQINAVRAEVRDERWNITAQHAHDIAALKKRAEQEQDFRDEMRREFDRLNLRLSKKGL